jgi:hypothetical protein
MRDAREAPLLSLFFFWTSDDDGEQKQTWRNDHNGLMQILLCQLPLIANVSIMPPFRLLYII